MENNNSTALVAFNTENTELGTVQHFIDTSTREGKIKLYSALQNAEKLDEHLNEAMLMSNAVAQAVQVTDDQTGEISNTVRVIIVTANGKAYAATSPTLAAGLNTMFSIFGTPNTWTEPLCIKVVERRSRRGFKFFSIEPVDEKAE
nr:MAG TPA: Single stranded DNA binding protein [Caudoviricetes sp.]